MIIIITASDIISERLFLMKMESDLMIWIVDSSSIFLNISWKKICNRNSNPDVFCKKGVLRNFSKFTGKHPCQTLFFNKVAGLHRTHLVAAYDVTEYWTFKLSQPYFLRYVESIEQRPYIVITFFTLGLKIAWIAIKNFKMYLWNKISKNGKDITKYLRPFKINENRFSPRANLQFHSCVSKCVMICVFQALYRLKGIPLKI